MIPWTQISHKQLAIDAVGAIRHYTQSLGLKYHNYDHVVAMYQYLEDTNEPYDEALDWAVLFHDVVYDKDPNKESRSAEMFEFNAQIPKYEIDLYSIPKTKRMILATEHHIVYDPEVSAIVRADLHALTNPVTTIENFVKIMEESCLLYKTTPLNFASNSESFMEGLSKRVHGNISSDPSHEVFYLKVIQGIRNTKKLGAMVQNGSSE